MDVLGINFSDCIKGSLPEVLRRSYVAMGIKTGVDVIK